MVRQNIRQYVWENVMNMLKIYTRNNSDVIESDSFISEIVEDNWDEIDLFTRLSEFFDIKQDVFLEHWDRIDTVEELCNHIVVLITQKQKELNARKPAKPSLVNKIKTMFQTKAR